MPIVNPWLRLTIAYDQASLSLTFDKDSDFVDGTLLKDYMDESEDVRRWTG